jgi:very-short-patch-repair endonuclease
VCNHRTCTRTKINIEVDGSHHNLSSEQAFSDLLRTYHSFREGYFTLRIPNSLIRDYFEETLDLITEIISDSED